jgi:hypothetical protein
MSQSVKQQMEVFIENLDYDFEQFNLAEFTRWLERRRGRPIVFVEWGLPPDVPGIWVACEECDYVYYDADTVPIHHTHHRLHELGHILREHAGLSFDGDAPLRPDESEDVEAEVLAALIQKRALRSAEGPSPDDDFVNSVEHYMAVLAGSSD